MKHSRLTLSISAGLALMAAAALGSCGSADSGSGNRLVILHTNDTHSHLDPDPTSDMGGAARRKVLIDSVRNAEPNVLLIDAGDAVQGTLYFHLYKGEAEQQVINDLGYDVQILGNHEFDNGTDALARILSEAKPTLLASNYEFADSSALDGLFVPYLVKTYAGKRVGMFAINLNPAGMVAEGNYDGVSYIDWQQVAQPTIDMLRDREGADIVIAVTHIGYSGSAESEELFGDCDLARQTRGLDIIIGAHSHDRLPDNLRLPDADGDSVLVVQTGKYGNYLGEITVDLASGKTSSRNIPVNSRLDPKLDPEFTGRIQQWRDGVDSLYRREVARVDSAAGSLNSSSQAMLNFAADFVAETGRELTDGVQGAITNKGGLRVTWHPGAVTEGAAIDMMPFANKITVIDIKGSDLLDALNVMAGRGGDAVSSEFDVRFESTSSKITAATLAGEPIAPDATYRIATIDYLANGGDYMTPFTHARKVAESTRIAYDDLLRYLKRHPVISPDSKNRMREYCLTVLAPQSN